LSLLIQLPVAICPGWPMQLDLEISTLIRAQSSQPATSIFSFIAWSIECNLRSQKRLPSTLLII
jgi:hypothetical protein